MYIIYIYCCYGSVYACEMGLIRMMLWKLELNNGYRVWFQVSIMNPYIYIYIYIHVIHTCEGYIDIFHIYELFHAPDVLITYIYFHSTSKACDNDHDYDDANDEGDEDDEDDENEDDDNADASAYQCKIKFLLWLQMPKHHVRYAQPPSISEPLSTPTHQAQPRTRFWIVIPVCTFFLLGALVWNHQHRSFRMATLNRNIMMHHTI